MTESIHKAAQLREKDVAGLQDELTSLRQKHFKLKMQHGSGQLNKTNELRQCKKAIARVLTIIGEMKRSQA